MASVVAIALLQIDTSHAMSALVNQKVTKSISVARIQLNNIVQTFVNPHINNEKAHNQKYPTHRERHHF